MGQFPTELVRSVITGELNLALVTAPSLNTDITAVPFAQAPLYAALPENHPAAENGNLELQDLAEDDGSYFRNGCIRLFMRPSWRRPAETGSSQNPFTPP
jgi:DNA-binding transcriptional LysR family regulator